jgi:hypothetical protein
VQQEKKSMGRARRRSPHLEITGGSMSDDNPIFVYIKIPEHIMPIDRAMKYEDPLQDALDSEGLGWVTGGGTLFHEADENGHKHIEYAGIDVEISDLEKGIALLKSEMARLGAPGATMLIYQRNGETVNDPVYA